jgi:DNA-binding NtrC family response regulator
MQDSGTAREASPDAVAEPRGGDSGPTGALLIVDDEVPLRAGLAEEMRSQGHRVFEAGSSDETYTHLGREVIDVVLLDLKLGNESGIDILRAIREDWPDTQVIMLTAYGMVETAVEAIKLGAFDFFQKPFDLTKLLVSVQNAIRGSALKEEVRFLRRRQGPRAEGEVVIGKSPAMAEVAAMVERVAPSRSTVLLLGETGVGKEVFARAIHRASAVADGPFVDVNCSSIPNDLLESELFGHEKGSFTSADRQKKGLFETAHGGTLFLDEIGEMSMGLQSKLLRVLEQRRFRRVGGTQDIRVDVRVIAATNRDLTERIADGRFRDDLYYRLAVVAIRIPPLRERPEDLEPLIESLSRSVARELGRAVPTLSPPARSLLNAYAWPGNVRELRNVLERAFLLGGGEEVLPDHLPAEIRGVMSPDRSDRRPGAVVATIDDAEREAIVKALAHTRGNKTLAAKLLGISRQTLRTKARRYGIEEESPVPSP